MFAFDYIAFENFKSYRGRHRFAFPAEPGLYFIRGINEAEAALGSNGSGKSTILDAIYWCLYGRTLRGLKSNDVVSWGCKSAFVELKMLVGDDTFIIKRNQSPNSLTLNGVLVEQEAILKAIRLNADVFIYTVIQPQFHTSFFELKPTEKLNLFSQILNLDYWLDLSKQAAAATAELDIKLGKIEQLIENEDRNIADLREEIEQLQVKESNFNNERQETIDQLWDQLGALSKEVKKAKEGKTKLTKALDELVLKRNERVDEIKRLEAKKAQYLSAREEQAATIATIKAKMEILNQNLERLRELGATCPTCLQPVDQKHLKRHRTDFSLQLDDLEVQLKMAGSESEGTRKFISKIWTDLAEIDEIIQKIDRDVGRAQGGMSQAQAAIDVAHSQEQGFKAAISAEEQRPNPYAEMLLDKSVKLEAALKAKTKAEDDYIQVEQKHDDTNYWVNGFKRVRLYLIEETLKAFEIEVNNALITLGLPDWQVEFDVERENKAGGITKGFTVLVRNSSNPEPIKFEAWSGGEGQRLQLAGDLGLSNLIMQQYGLEGAIEFYDEPTSHLSDVGRHDLALTLHQRAVEQGKVVFLIDHSLIEFGDFADVIEVAKGQNGSSFQ